MLETKATPSQPTNVLISLATQLLEGEDVSEQFDEKLSAQVALVESELELVPQRAKDRGPEFIEHIPELYDSLVEHMQLYYEGLTELGAYLDVEEDEEGDPQCLEAGIARLLEVTGPLVELQDAYGRAFAAFGPSRFPMVNALDRLLGAYRQDSDEHQEELVNVLGMMKHSIEQSLDVIPEGEVGSEDARSGYQKAHAILCKLEKEHKDHSTHEGHITKLGEALFQIETGDEELRLSLQEGPTSMPAANIFINTARKALAGKLPKEAVPPALAAYVGHVAENWGAIEKELEKPIDSATIQDELPNTMELVDAHEDIMERLQEAYDAGFEAEAVEEGITDLIEVVELFKTSAQVFIEAASREGQRVCVSCGRGNPRTNRVCEACGAAMPNIVDDEQSDSTFELSEHGGLEDDPNRMVMTTNLARLFKACEDVEAGEIDAAEFEATLRWADNLLDQMSKGGKKLEAELNQMSAGAEERPEQHEELATLTEVLGFFEEGIDEWEAGLLEMARFLDEPDGRYLKSGMKRVWEGASAIHRCKLIGDAAQAELDEREAKAAEEEHGPQDPEDVAG